MQNDYSSMVVWTPLVEVSGEELGTVFLAINI
jgi:hypothetical protein